MNSRLKTVLLAAIAGVICTGGLTAGGDGAKAQSFDCAKASTRVERLICDNPRLDELDSDLAEAYRTLTTLKTLTNVR